jgi:serine/threonine protein phosphatase PrpC
MRFLFRGQSDVGRKREENEDSFLVNEPLGLAVVADGMGGHAGGGTASRIAVETIERALLERRNAPGDPFVVEAPLAASPVPEALRDAVETACQTIYHTARGNPNLAGMGTTVTAMLLHGHDAFFAHVGDSRAYLVRGEFIQQISEDHSLVNEQLKAGVITQDEARSSRFRNIITRSVGFEEDVLVDLMGLTAEPGDVFVLCSDGLANLVDDGEILAATRGAPVEALPERLIELANERGGDDNITVVCVQAVEG